MKEYRRRVADPALGYQTQLPALPPAAPVPAVAAPAPAPPPTEETVVPSSWATLTCEQAAQRFITENPKLLGSETGKREAKWTPKTRSQFETAMRLLCKSMGDKPFWSMGSDDLHLLLRQLLRTLVFVLMVIAGESIRRSLIINHKCIDLARCKTRPASRVWGKIVLIDHGRRSA